MSLAAISPEFLKYLVLAITFPIWMPFLKALYAELNDALAEEGGLFGRTPTSAEMPFIVNDPNRSKSPLVSTDFPVENQPPARSRSAAPSSATPARRRSGGLGSNGFSKARSVRGFARKDQETD